MRFIHTADWHLGRLLHGVSLVPDQSHVLAQLIDIVKATAPDCLIVAGDIYDRAVPPPEAVELLDDVLSRLLLDLAVPVLMIAGNHDSSRRVGYGARLLEPQQLHLAARPARPIRTISMMDEHGPVYFYLLPYADPPQIRQLFDCPEVRRHDDVMARLMAEVREQHPAGSRAIVVAHGSIAGGAMSESERPLSTHDGDAADPGHFGDVHYAALGHLHKPQTLGTRLRYSGSLLKYSFSEVDDSKGVDLVEIDGTGRIHSERLPLMPRYDMRRLRGYFAELLAAAGSDSAKEDYLRIDLLDERPVLDVMQRLRQAYPNILDVSYERRQVSHDTPGASRQTQAGSEIDMFDCFHQEARQRPLTASERRIVAEVVDACRREEREADAE